MGSKNSPGNFDCYAAAHPDEPMFVILGRDPIGGAIVRQWAAARPALNKAGDAPKIVEAMSCADAMDAWCRKVGRVPTDTVANDPRTYAIFGWWDHFNAEFVGLPEDAERRRAGGNKVEPLYMISTGKAAQR